MLTGPNHKRLLSASMFFGACFLMLADLLSRTIVRPMELPVGVVTSFIGAVAFVFIFKKSGRVG
jgi:iron complex transport system permease protein